MKPIKLAIIGAGGYGDYCLGLLERFVDVPLEAVFRKRG